MRFIGVGVARITETRNLKHPIDGSDETVVAGC